MILLTGFEPFGGDDHNPSAVVAQALGSDAIAVRILPVDGERIHAALEQAVQETQPSALVMLGLARGRTRISLERIAINWLEYRIADNAGRRVLGQKILPDAPDALFSSLPLEAMQQHLRQAALPFEVSLSAGAYLCNQVFFLARVLYSDLPAGFIHLPSDERLAMQRSEAFVPLEQQVQAVRKCLEVLQNRHSETVKGQHSG
jgi:pyroglutamyl-peptidase